MDPKLRKVVDTINSGLFGDANIYSGLMNSIETSNDYYLVSDDFDSYLRTQDMVDEAFKDKDGWAERSINSVAQMGFFSADRCINEYDPP